MTGEPKTYTQEEFDALTARHQEELNALEMRFKNEYKRKIEKAEKEALEKAEEEARKAQMTELEKATAERDEYMTKYKEAQDAIALTSQKDETRAFLKELGVDGANLDYVFVPKDMEATKARAKAFKDMIDNVKKETFESNVKSTIPNNGNPSEPDDVFLQGFNEK